jgi:diadenosine tetraphosphate (Ap4A) HIT family hydrolase
MKTNIPGETTLLQCEDCGFDLWIPVAEYEHSVLGLYNDDRFPGRCILMIKGHYEHLDEVPSYIAEAFMRETIHAGGAVRKVMGAARVNYATLGNTLAHVHTHIIPRYKNDLVPTRPPWEHPDKAGKLSSEEVRDIVTRLQNEIVPSSVPLTDEDEALYAGYVARIVPQAWVNDYAVIVDDEGPSQWNVTPMYLKKLVEYAVKNYTHTIESAIEEATQLSTDLSDELRYDPGAPSWVQDWDGPFYCEAWRP